MPPAKLGLKMMNPRVIPKTKTVVFDLQANLPRSEPALIGSVRYFNHDDLEFPEIGCYAVWVSVARTLPTAEVYSQDLGPMDYHILGENFSLSQPAFVQICGLASNINKDDATFDVVVQQYISATRSAECFPTRCFIPDTPRFQNYKPIPNKGKFVSVTGFLTGVERDDDHTVKHFLIDVDQVVFLGQRPHSASAPKAEQSSNKIVSGTPAPVWLHILEIDITKGSRCVRGLKGAAQCWPFLTPQSTPTRFNNLGSSLPDLHLPPLTGLDALLGPRSESHHVDSVLRHVIRGAQGRVFTDPSVPK
ncbi:hypothetical protein B0H14DRAFT_3466537 [Mycena olivaceomarginata]|nr:hypothetical protein B0H14DRAFT_3466537 [Mycena olivaceomarginata]